MNVFDVLREKILERAKGIAEFSQEEKLDKELAIANRLDELKSVGTIIDEVEKEFATDTNVRNNGWILCSERLPDKNKPVLCWVRSTTIASGETFIIGLCDRGFWFLQTYEIGHHHFPVKDYEVIAWQPLPPKYEPKDVTNK